MPGKLDALATDVEAEPVIERLLGRRPGRVVVAHEQLARLLVPDAGDVSVE